MPQLIWREQVMAAVEALDLNPHDVYALTLKSDSVIVDLVDRDEDGEKVRNDRGGLCLTTVEIPVY